MSEISENQEKNQISIFEILILAVAALAVAPLLPFNIIYMFLILKTDRKENFILYPCIGIIAVMFAKIGLFFEETAQIATMLVKGLFNHKFVISAYGNYHFTSWVILTAVSFAVASYAVKRIRYNRNFENAGMSSLIGVIERIGTRHMKYKIDTENATLIGRTRLNRLVYFLDNAKHALVSGTSGSGKTFVLFNIILYAIIKFIGLLIVDGKGDTGKNSILEVVTAFCKKHNRELCVIDMNNPSTSAKYNPFRYATPTAAADMLISLSGVWSEEFYKANTERYIQRVIKMLNVAEVKLSFKSIIEYMVVDKFESLSATLQKNDLIDRATHIENLELIKASGKIAEQAVARFATIAESEMGQIFDENGIDIYTALNSGKVILFVLNPLLYPETAKAFGRLVLIDGKQAVSKLFGKNKRSFFVFDEINVYASTALIDLINKSRSAGVTCISATQSLADLEVAAGEAFTRQVIENNNNYFVLRTNEPSTAEKWAKIIGTKEVMEITHQLSGNEPTGMGSARKNRAFVVHPDEIKELRQGECVFLSRDTGTCERIKVVNPL